MAPIQFLFTSAFVLSAAIAAPIHSNHVGAGKAGASAPSKHHSEPMRMADPVMSSVPMMSINTQAMKASAAAMAIQTPPSMASGQQSDGVFGVLNKLPVKREQEERRQLGEVTSLLTSINSIAKRDGEIEERQLGLIKSVPEAVGQAAQVEKLVTSLPIKRDGIGILEGLGGLGNVLGGVKRDVEQAEKRDETYTEKALKGFQEWIHHGTKEDKEATPETPSAADSLGLGDIAKRGDPVSSLLKSILAKRDTEASKPNDELIGEAIHKAEDETHEDVEDETYTEKALKGFQGWIHKGSKKAHKDELPTDNLGLSGVIKRGSPTDPITDLLGLLAKREDGEIDENMLDELAKRSSPTDPVAGLLSGVLAKRDEMESDENMIDGLAKREDTEADEQMLDELAKRSSPTDPIAGLLGGVLAKRDEMESDENMIDGLAKRDIDDAIATASDALTNLAKRSGLDSVDALIKGLTKGGQLNNGLNIRQLNILSSLATGALSNAGTAAGELGKVAAGKHRRGNGDADAGPIAAAATAGMNVGNHPKAGSDDDDVDAIVADVAEGEQTLHDATSPQGHAGGHLDKRQVPPIAGSDALSIVKGLVANPSAALTPITKGVLVGGTALGDMAPQ